MVVRSPAVTTVQCDGHHSGDGLITISTSRPDVHGLPFDGTAGGTPRGHPGAGPGRPDEVP